MKKKLNETGITNELRGNSVYFQPDSAAEVEQVTETKPRKRTQSARKTATVAAPAGTERETAPVEQPGTAQIVVTPPPQALSKKLPSGFFTAPMTTLCQ